MDTILTFRLLCVKKETCADATGIPFSCNPLVAWMMCSQPAPTRHRLTWQPLALRRLQRARDQTSPHAVPLRRKVKGFPHPLLVRRVLPHHPRLNAKAPHPRLLSLQEVGDVPHETALTVPLSNVFLLPPSPTPPHPHPHALPVRRGRWVS